MSQYSDLDYYNLAKPLDFVTMSSYPTGHAESKSALYMSTSRQPVLAYDVGDPYLTGMGHALMRGFKQGNPFWVMEQQCGHVNWSQYNTGIRKGTVRLWTWHALTSGAESIIYFRWRAGLYAQEQHHSGLLRHDASPAVGYADLEAMQAEQTLMSEISAFPKEAHIALLIDYDTLWALRLQPHHREIDYMRLLFVYYRALGRLGYPADIVSIDADLSPYKLVIVPTAFVATDQTTRSLEDYAESGGTILLGVRSGVKTSSNRVTNHEIPGLFRELVGITVSDWHSLPPGVSYDFTSSIPGLDGPATVWAEALNLQLDGSKVTGSDVQILAQYNSNPFNDDAALVEHKFGSGSAFYLGWFPTDQQAMALLSYLASQSEIPSIAMVPDGLIVSKRGPYLILLNFTDETLSATVLGTQIEVRPRDVQVVDTL
jgi:beta-galactosidase